MIYTFSFSPAVPAGDINVVGGASIVDVWDAQYGVQAHLAFRGHIFRVAGQREQRPGTSEATLEIECVFVRDELEGHGDEDASRELAAGQLVTAIATTAPRKVHAQGWWSVDDGMTKRGDTWFTPQELQYACSVMEEGGASVNCFAFADGYYG